MHAVLTRNKEKNRNLLVSLKAKKEKNKHKLLSPKRRKENNQNHKGKSKNKESLLVGAKPGHESAGVVSPQPGCCHERIAKLLGF